MRTLVVGAGIFGVTAARELRARGAEVVLLDPGPVPHVAAASTDISKVVRREYGADAPYTAWMDDALQGFRRWNSELGDTLFHETGVLFMSGAPLAEGGFEADSLALLEARGAAVHRVTRDQVAARFPGWAASPLPEGLHDEAGGWVESGRLVGRLAELAVAEGVVMRQGRALRLLERAGRIVGVAIASEHEHEHEHADEVVLCMGAWTTDLVPSLAVTLRAVAQPVFHLRPREPALFEGGRFPVFGADIARAGWYGFPLHPHAGVVKVAHHGAGLPLHPDSPARVVGPADIARLRGFLGATFPALADAELVHTRACMYSDTADGHLLIARDPERAGLTVAAGDSGHAFKFAPLLGRWIADAALETAAPPARFAWRSPAPTPAPEPGRTPAPATPPPTGDAARARD
ncbi:MAG: FAD-dependent oxidoreductase [Deltaproteobacteria bacterium]|nr:FAD-dependent oxidoreductase [Deltaproteobacteria bacterium]